MNLLDPHPDAAALTRATDDALTPDEQEAVRAHVAACAACAEDVAASRALRLRVREAPLAARPDRLVERALARRRGGERVLLPIAEEVGASPAPVVPRARAGSRALLAAASFAIVAVGAWALLAPPGLAAAPPSERVRIVSGRPQLGQTVELEYAALPALAGRESLVVRAFSITDADVPEVRWHDPLTVLHRDATRRFRGSFTWPSAATVSIAVEAADGMIVDSNDGDLVDLLATDDAGRPTFEALVTSVMRGNRYFGAPGGRSDSRSLHARADELERRFPDQPESWALAAAHARAPSLWDAWFGAFARRTRALERLDRDLAAKAELPPRARRAMLALARSQEEPEVATEWARRVGGDTVVNPWAGRERTVATIVRERDAVAARVFLRDSLQTAVDYFLAVGFGTFDRLGSPGDHAPLVPCAELRAAFARAHAQSAVPRRPVGVSAAAFAAWRENGWTGQQELVSLCGVPYPERLARYHAWAKTANPPDWAALRAMWRAPRDPREP